MSDRVMIGEEDFESIVSKLAALESGAADAKADFTKELKLAVHDHHLNKQAFELVRKFLGEEPARSSEFYIHLTYYWRLSELPKGDLFGDVP